jgi:hypothetical protein
MRAHRRGPEKHRADAPALLAALSGMRCEQLTAVAQQELSPALHGMRKQPRQSAHLRIADGNDRCR